MNTSTTTGLNRRNNARRLVAQLEAKARRVGLNRTEAARLTNARRNAA